MLASWCNSGSTVMAEILAAAGLDAVVLDAEHAPLDLATIHALCQAVRAGNPHCAAVVRLPTADPILARRVLDAGARGIIIPMVEDPQRVAAVIAATRYPPAGVRGVGFAADNAYGMGLQSILSQDEVPPLVGVMIETQTGLERMDALLSVPGLHCALIGPYDLSASLGVPGLFDHPRFAEAERAFTDACERHGVLRGCHIVRPDHAALQSRLAEGYRFLGLSLDITFVSDGVSAMLSTARKGGGSCS